MELRRGHDRFIAKTWQTHILGPSEEEDDMSPFLLYCLIFCYLPYISIVSLQKHEVPQVSANMSFALTKHDLNIDFQLFSKAPFANLSKTSFGFCFSLCFCFHFMYEVDVLIPVL
jgi:hypothetical protein